MHLGIIIGQIHKIGGMEKQAILLANELKKRAIKVTLFISGLKRNSRKSESLNLRELTIKYLFNTRYTHFVSKHMLKYYCKQQKISHLIGYNPGNTHIAIDANMNLKIALNVRGIRFSAYPKLAEEYRRVADKCDWVITNSSNTANLLQENRIAKKSKIEIILNGIKLPDIKPIFNTKRVLYVGSIKEVKDPMTFVRACHDVINQDKEVKIIMAGDGDMKPIVEEYIHKNNLENNFNLMGEVALSKIPYKEAGVFVNSSIRESNSNSLLEALSFGIPVVAADNPGNRDVISNLDHHQLVPISDSKEMGKAITNLLNIDNEQRQEIFKESRMFIRNNFSISKMVDKYIQLLESL